MSEPEITTEEKEIVTTEPTAAVVADVVAKPAFGSNSSFGNRSRNARPQRKTNKRDPRSKPEYDQRMINIRRVTRVSSGGRRFSFSVVLVVGNHKGSVGVATGKAGDTTLAIDKAYRAAKKNAFQIRLLKNMSIPHEVQEKFKGSIVSLSPAKGKGMIAGSAARDIIELAGIKDINAKIHSPSKNKLNIAHATIKALKALRVPRKFERVSK
ncbi:MAG: 30S ribosomal protein S5 [Candidatus Paceibacterota bacterium]